MVTRHYINLDLVRFISQHIYFWQVVQEVDITENIKMEAVERVGDFRRN